MLRFQKLVCLAVLLLISSSFADDTINKDKDSHITFFSRFQPTGDYIIQPMGVLLTVLNDINKDEIYSSSKDDNLIYAAQFYPRSSLSSPAPKPIKDITESLKRPREFMGLTIKLIEIPSSTDSEEIRQKYLDIACEDFEKKLQTIIDNRNARTQNMLKSDKEGLSRIEKELQQLSQRKAEAEIAENKNKLKTEILAYLYKEKVKLDLDRLEQAAKLAAITGFYDRISNIQNNISKTADEISAMEDELKQISITGSPEEKVVDMKKRIEQARKKWRSLQESLKKDPENAIPKEQYVDVKIALAATERRFQEVGKLISEYEQTDKNADNLVKLVAQLESLEKKKSKILESIKSNENSLQNRKDNLIRVIKKEDYDAEQKKKVENQEE